MIVYCGKLAKYLRIQGNKKLTLFFITVFLLSGFVALDHNTRHHSLPHKDSSSCKSLNHLIDNLDQAKDILPVSFIKNRTEKYFNKNLNFIIYYVLSSYPIRAPPFNI